MRDFHSGMAGKLSWLTRGETSEEFNAEKRDYAMITIPTIGVLDVLPRVFCFFF